MDMELEDYDDMSLDELVGAEGILPFGAVLDGIFGEGDVNIAGLFRLSDMNVSDHDAFMQRWSTAHDARRFVVARHLADLSEENFEVEYAPLFKHFLDDKSELVRMAALDGLWDTTNSSAIPPIIRLLKSDPVEDVRKAAASTLAHVILLGEWGQVSERLTNMAAEALIETYADYDNPVGVRRAALESLGASSHERVPALIREAYESDHGGLQLSAVFAMGNSADIAWVGTIMAEMANPKAEMRAEAARAAGELGSSDTISELAQVVFDIDEEVQLAAVESLGKLGSDRANVILEQFAQDEELEHLHEAIGVALSDTKDVLGGAPFDPFGDEDDEDEEDNDDWDLFDPDADYLSY